MTILAKKIADHIGKSSWIRRMFELGEKMKAERGAENVYDFSLGNPDLPPPPEVAQALRKFADNADKPFAFGYMPNGGFPALREKLAAELSEEQGIKLGGEDVILTCGAAGALNSFFRAALDPGEEVLTFAPYFVEYGFYCENNGGVLKPVPSRPEDFSPDLDALEKAITANTRAVLINSPHNPTGAVYGHGDLVAITRLLENKSQRYGRPIWLVADEPYRFLVYDGAKASSVLPLYPYSAVVSSFSKNMSLPGERIGYLIVSPKLREKGELMAALAMTNRILGFVNPPVVGQRILEEALGARVDVSVYEARRRAMARALKGYDFVMPKGAFYFFPKAPGGDDVAFVNRLLEEGVLAVPGSGFGWPGHFRLAFCVEEDVINRAAPGFARALADPVGKKAE